jgi:hypothetical protein
VRGRRFARWGSTRRYCTPRALGLLERLIDHLSFLDANVHFAAAYRPDVALRRLWRLPGMSKVSGSNVRRPPRAVVRPTHYPS